MKRFISFFLVVVILSGMVIFFHRESTGDLTYVEIVRVVDGDTYVLKNGEKVRIIGVNAPEIRGREPYGEEAKDFAVHYLEGRKVYLEKDCRDRDQYGRLLRYVWLKPPRKVSKREFYKYNFSGLLLERGYARVYTFKPDTKYYDYFVKIEKKARKSRRGIWERSDPVTRGNNLR